MRSTPSQDEIHLWQLDVDAAPLLDASCLAPDERERAARFHFEHDRRRWTTTRVWLRHRLAGYLGVEPATIELSYGPQGKPALANSDLVFNLSHAHALALLAVTRGEAIGVDIEHVRDDFPVMEVAGLNFTERECAALASAVDLARVALFYRLWTRKEAMLKAVGTGLSTPLTEIDVLSSVEGWFIDEIDVHPRYAAALARRTTSSTPQLAWQHA